MPHIQRPQLGTAQGGFLEGVVDGGCRVATAIHSDDEVRRLLGDMFGLTYDHHRAHRVREDRQCDGGRREQLLGSGQVLRAEHDRRG
ncbi:hypothetical protein OHU45_38070 [Streptomyces tubercidicus]|uniref:hypothetical protein n=1 Tax=Streptomyces tubercidicus TaxID=47759 RepID=UPI003756F5B0